MILSIITFGCTIWGGGCGVREKSKISRLIKEAAKITNHQLDGIDKIQLKAIERKSFEILNNKKHVLHHEFNSLPSGRRYREIKCRTNRYKFTFIPQAIKAINKALSNNEK